MSHFTKIKVPQELQQQLKDPELLKQTLENLGYHNVTYHQEPQLMNDWYTVRGRKRKSSNYANVIVPYEGNNGIASDFGYLMTNHKLTLQCDSYDQNSLEKMQSEKLAIAYHQAAVEQTIINQARAMNRGQPIIERLAEDNRVTLRIAYPQDQTKYTNTNHQPIRR